MEDFKQCPCRVKAPRRVECHSKGQMSDSTVVQGDDVHHPTGQALFRHKSSHHPVPYEGTCTGNRKECSADTHSSTTARSIAWLPKVGDITLGRHPRFNVIVTLEIIWTAKHAGKAGYCQYM